jgi:endo-1,4-beta-mannosidase
LIRHRYGIYGFKDAAKRVDFFTDKTMLEAFKKLITFFLNRVNTYSGIRYGDDKTILAFETGNEMSWKPSPNTSKS